jgi:hypothetical protein
MTLSAKGSAGQAQWRPFREFENLYAEMDRLAQSVFSGVSGDGAWLPAATSSRPKALMSSKSNFRVYDARTSMSI